MLLTRILHGVHALFRRKRLDDDLEAELRAYLDDAVDRRVADGMCRQDAERAARVEIGSFASVAERTRSVGWEAAVEALVSDVRDGWRSLFRSPGFTAVAALTLALAIGATTSIFTIVDAVLIQPLADPAAMRLVRVYHDRLGPSADTPADASRRVQMVPSLSTFEDWRAANQVFDGMALHRVQRLTIIAGDTAERVDAVAATPELFRIFDARPVLGRLLTRQDEGRAVTLISHGAWQRRFGGDRLVIGRTFRTSEGSRTVVGVLPSDFGRYAPMWRGFSPPAEFWIPLDPAPLMRVRAGWGGSLTARLREGVTLDAANAGMRAVVEQRAREGSPDAARGVGVELLHELSVRDRRSMLLILLGGVGCVLLIGCVNVAGLLVARGVDRRREMALRAAIGGGSVRMVRQLLAESLALALLGAAGGMFLAYAAFGVLRRILPVPLPEAPTLDLRSLAFAAAVSIVAGLLFGLVPALRLSKPRLVRDLKDGAQGTPRWAWKAGRLLIVTEVALALVLTVGAGLMGRSLLRVLAIDPGFQPGRVLVLEAAPALPLRAQDTRARSLAFYDALIERMRRIPGVEAVSAVDNLPFWSNTLAAMEIDGPELSRTGLGIRHVLPGYFDVMGIRLIAGRDFTRIDRAGAPCVAVVNERAAREHWARTSAIGQRLRRYQAEEWCEVVGIVADIRHSALESEREAEVFFSALQSGLDGPDLTVVARSPNPGALVSAVRAQANDLPEPVIMDQAVPFEHFLDLQTGVRRNRAASLSLLGGLAVLLAAVGVFGLSSYSVARRTPEIGIRIALGATRTRAFRAVLGAFAPAIGLGVAVGLGAAAALSRLLAGYVYGIEPVDAVTFVSAGALLTFAALLACCVPAGRAARVDPLVALRSE